MQFLRFNTRDGVISVPVTDVKSVLEKPDGTGVVAFKTDLQPIAVRNVTTILKRLMEPTTLGSSTSLESIFDSIFGKI